MTDPLAFDFDHVTYRSGASEANLSPQAISLSPVALEPEGRRVSMSTNHPSILSTSAPTSRTTVSADDTNPFAEPPLPSDQYELDPPLVTVHDTNSEQNLAPGSANAASAANTKLAQASFDSEPWSSTFSGPYLGFAPRPVYEPTGELQRERTPSFDHFHSPVNYRSLNSSASSHDPRPALDPTSATVHDQKTVNVFVQPSLPKSALKRKANFAGSPVTEDPGRLPSNPNGPRPSRARTVSFEQMSGLGPTSPDEGSTASDLQAGQARSSNAAQRRTRHSSTSTPRGAAQATPVPTHGTGRLNRGTRAPSGHPPLILPPEKVFPIQIGSELFRLSGASISSDGNNFGPVRRNSGCRC
jgi:hypothetical protein